MNAPVVVVGDLNQRGVATLYGLEFIVDLESRDSRRKSRSARAAGRPRDGNQTVHHHLLAQVEVPGDEGQVREVGATRGILVSSLR